MYGENTSRNLSTTDTIYERSLWKVSMKVKLRKLEAAECLLAKRGGPSWSDNRFVACRFGHVVVMGVVKTIKIVYLLVRDCR